MNYGQSSQFNRQISSSQSCHCKYCVMESESNKGNKRSTLAFQLNKNKYLPKRRGVPPVKKEGCLKQGSQQPKPINKKGLQFKGIAPLDIQQKKATPARQKYSDVNRILCLTGVFDNYHAVSQSKREKLIRQIKGGRQQGGLGIVPQNRPYAMQMEYFGRRRKINSSYDKNIQPQLRCESKQARSKSSYQASPSNPHSQASKHESIRSRSAIVTDQQYHQRGNSLQN